MSSFKTLSSQFVRNDGQTVSFKTHAHWVPQLKKWLVEIGPFLRCLEHRRKGFKAGKSINMEWQAWLALWEKIGMTSSVFVPSLDCIKHSRNTGPQHRSKTLLACYALDEDTLLSSGLFSVCAFWCVWGQNWRVELAQQLLASFIAATLPGPQLMRCNFEDLFTSASAECPSPLGNGKCSHIATQWQQAGEWQQGPSQQHMAVKKLEQLSLVYMIVHVQQLWHSISVRHWLQKHIRPCVKMKIMPYPCLALSPLHKH